MTQALKQQDIKDLLRGITIPSPPQVIADLQMEMAMPDPDINEIAKFISNDAGLSGSVLKLVNSPFYGDREKVTSISKAVLMLGMDTIVDIVNTICLKKSFMDSDSVSDNLYATMIRFWDSATDIARVCSMVGTRLHLSPLDNVYTLGLFHNVGISLMVSTHENYLDVMRKSYHEDNDRIIDIENEEYGTNHAVLSYFTARTWKLNQNLCDLIAQHHNPNMFLDKDFMEKNDIKILSVLKIAEHIVGLYRILGNESQDKEWNMISENVLLAAGLSEYELEDLSYQAKDFGYGQQQYFN